MKGKTKIAIAAGALGAGAVAVGTGAGVLYNIRSVGDVIEYVKKKQQEA